VDQRSSSSSLVHVRWWLDPLRQVFLVGSGLRTVRPCIADHPRGTSHPRIVRELDTNHPIFEGCILEVMLAFFGPPSLDPQTVL
jgi:hypothetical protein